MNSSAASLPCRLALRPRPLRFTSRPPLFRTKPTQASRYASDTPSPPQAAPTPAPKRPRIKGKLIGTTLALTLVVGYVYATDTRASIHRYGVVPLIRWLYPDAEDAHHVGVDALSALYRLGLNPRERGNPDGDGMLQTEVASLLI